MAQDFNLRYPLVDGQGNFGSVDGDSAGGDALHRSPPDRDRRRAAGRHRQEHRRLQAQLRRLDAGADGAARRACRTCCINGSAGIAVGMATNIPPHNLNEICDAIIHADRQPGGDRRRADGDRPGSGLPDRRHDPRPRGHPRRLRHRPRPGRHPRQGVRRGSRRAATATRSSSPSCPYQVNKAALMERIAELVKDGKLDGISDLRDESDRTGMRDGHRAEARRPADEGAQQPLQAHRPAADLRRQHARAGRTTARSRAS